MDRRSRHRIGKCEELLSAALKERDERLKQVLQVAPTYARRHAAAVAAIVLSGRPRIDEPLERLGRVLCSTTGLTSTPIKLPPLGGFFLRPFNSEVQRADFWR